MTEIERAHQLLKSSSELLEATRNRSRAWSTIESDEPRFTREAQQVFDRTLAEQEAKRLHREAQHTMNAQNSKAWNDWAKSAARKMFMDEMAPVIAEALKARDASIAQLEQRVQELEQSADPKLARIPGKAA